MKASLLGEIMPSYARCKFRCVDRSFFLSDERTEHEETNSLSQYGEAVLQASPAAPLEGEKPTFPTSLPDTREQH